MKTGEASRNQSGKAYNLSDAEKIRLGLETGGAKMKARYLSRGAESMSAERATMVFVMRVNERRHMMPRYIDANELLRNTIYNPRHVPYISETDIILAQTSDVVERKRGTWIDLGKDRAIRWQCSECGRKDTHIYNYCPDCGSDNREESDNEVV